LRTLDRAKPRRSSKYREYRSISTSDGVAGAAISAGGTTPKPRKYESNGTSPRDDTNRARPAARRSDTNRSTMATVKSPAPKSCSASHRLTSAISPR
jgi:hypothetical protein